MFAIFAVYKHLEHGSKRHTPHSGATFLHSSLPLILSCSPLFSLSVFVPVLTPRPASDLIFLSLSWLAGTPFRGQSPWVREQKKTQACARIGAQVNTCNHTQTQACALGCRLILHTNQYTDEYTHREANLLHTHTSTHFQSPPASCLPTLHLINPCVSLTKQERALSSLWTLEQVA